MLASSKNLRRGPAALPCNCERENELTCANRGEIFVWLISDRRMAHLHRKFLGLSGPTDVLTFQHGEIFISVETARRQRAHSDIRSCAS